MFGNRVIKCANEDEWLVARRDGIGASDAAVILGVSSFSSPYQLWAEKVELVESADLSDREWIYWGHRFEREIAMGFGERIGRAVDMWPHFHIVRHAELDWMRCTPDAIQGAIEEGDYYGSGLVEIKNVGAHMLAEWQDEPPLLYQVQIQHQMEVTGLTWGTLAAVVGGQRLVWFDVRRNDDFIAAMVNAEAKFWKQVQQQEPPDIDGSKATAETIKKLNPNDSGESIALPVEAITWAERLDELKAEIKKAEEQRRLIENQIKASIGGNTFGVLADGSGFSYKTQARKGFTVEPGQSRVLRRIKCQT